jgi:hypothetical protein
MLVKTSESHRKFLTNKKKVSKKIVPTIAMKDESRYYSWANFYQKNNEL